MDIYAQNILDRYKKPFHKDKKLDASVHHKEANHSCGDAIEIDLKLENDKVTDYSFSGNGCAISMASADMLGDIVMGLTKKEALNLTKENLYKILGIEISVRRSKCALLPLLAVQNSLLDEPRSWSDFHI